MILNRKYRQIKCRLLVIFIVTGITTHSFSQQLPLKPARQISFTTTEGTNMDVDISPDGKTIVFDLLGELFVMPSVGGNATQLTHSLAINTRPTWSPDSKYIAYLSDSTGSMHLQVMDMQTRRAMVLGALDPQLELFFSPQPVWSPDGFYISLENLLYGRLGGKLFAPKDLRNPIAFSADGNAAYYFNGNKFYRYDKTGDTLKLLSPKRYKAYSSAVSANGHWWVYVTDSAKMRCLMIQDLFTNEDHVLIKCLDVNTHYSDYFPTHLSFSADNSNVYIGFGGKIHCVNAKTGDDRVIPFKANVRSQLAAFNYNTYKVVYDSLQVRYNRFASASTDGKYVVFTALNKVYIKNLPDGKPHLLINQPFGQFQPVFSPDNNWVAYVSWSDADGGQLWRVPVNGGKPEQITKVAGQYQWPAWSPDGKMIAVIKGPKLLTQDGSFNCELENIELKSQAAKIIADSLPLVNCPYFSGDSKRIIYQPKAYIETGSPVGDPPVREQILSVSRNIDGKDEKIVGVGIPTYSYIFQPRTISPDGRYMVYSRGENLYLVPLVSSIAPPVITDVIVQNIWGIHFATGIDPKWEQGGKSISWSHANSFNRVEVAKIISAAENSILSAQGEGRQDGKYVTALVKPDQVIDLDLTVPVDHAKGILALTNCRIITMQGTKVIGNGTIIMQNGRLIAIGSTDQIKIPQLAKVIDLSGKTIMPGLIDLHLHMPSPPDISPQQNWAFLVNLAYGVTTARNPSSNFENFAYQELLGANQMIGPRLYTSGLALRDLDGILTIGHMEDAITTVQKRKDLNGVIIKQYQQPTRLQRQWVAMASKAAGMNMTNEGDPVTIGEIGMLKDGSSGVEHSPDWSQDTYEDVIKLFSGSGTFLTPTLQVAFEHPALNSFNYKYWREPNEKLNRFLPESELKIIHDAKAADTTATDFIYASQVYARIRHAGGKVTLGGHGNDQGIGAHNELWALQMGGLTNMEALQAGTIMSAEALGMQKDLGSLEPGKIADLIILNSNPLDDIHNSRDIKYVMHDGILYDGDTLDEIWPVKKKCPEWRLAIKK